MRFLADENIPGDTVAALRAAGHDVVWVRTEAPGIVDQEVLALSAAESRVLLTFDKDFGELAWNARLAPSCGIVLFRLAAMGATEVCNGIATILNGRDDWVGHFSVVEASRIRMRPLPLSQKIAQLVIATHSPMLLTFPNATIWSLDAEEIRTVTYQETDHFQITRDFLNAPERYYRHLLEDGD
jgi:predicted nuclease of predicted toxin-antitoxin system